MARSMGTQIESQLLEARGRLRGGSIDGGFYDANVRFWQLGKSLEGVGSGGDPELFRHFPVASVAILESHFKATVTAIVDAGSPYLERGLQLAKDRLKFAADVPLLHRKSATIGELVAYVLPFNSISSLESTFGTLFDDDLKVLVAQVKDPYDERNERPGAEAIVPNIEVLWRGLSQAFDRRHILAHEAATRYVLSFDDAKSDIDSCALISKALDALMWSTVWRAVPLTQYEMNVAAWKSCKAVRAVLAAKIRAALAISTEDGKRARFRQMHAAWKTFTRQWLSWEDEPFVMGSIRPMLNAIAQERSLKARLESIEAWISLMRPESGTSGE